MDKLLEKHEIKKFIGQAIRYVRTEQGMTLEELAPHVDLGDKYIGRIECGEINITLTTLSKISEGLEVPLSRLFGVAEELSNTSTKGN